MNVAGLERAERPLAARTAVPYWSAYTALAIVQLCSGITIP
jgi:hypothetical protein